MPECEICGFTGEVRKFVIEGATVLACRRCQSFGKAIDKPKTNDQLRPKSDRRSLTNQNLQIAGRRPTRPRRQEKMLIDNFGEAITQARTKMGLSRRKLGMQINEKESLLVRIEHQKLTPSDPVVEKIERALGIELYTQSIEETSGAEFMSLKSDATTLGLVAKIKRKQKK